MSEIVDKTEYFECECTSRHHTLSFYICQNEKYKNDNEFNVEIILNNYLPWHKRIWNAFRYVFKMDLETNYYYDTWSLKDADIERMINLLEQYKGMKKNLKTNPSCFSFDKR